MRIKKTYDYIIVIKAPAAYKLIDFFSQLLMLMSIAAFILAGIKNLQGNFLSNLKNISTLYFLTVVVIFYWLIYCNNQKKKGNEVYYRFGLLIAAFGWYLNKSEWLFFSIAYLVIAILEKPLKVLPEAAFDKEKIVFNSFPQKKYLWKDVANAILKDNILTIDLKNNKLIQKEIDAEISEADEKDFNEFCKERLMANG